METMFARATRMPPGATTFGVGGGLCSTTLGTALAALGTFGRSRRVRVGTSVTAAFAAAFGGGVGAPVEPRPAGKK